MTDLCIEINVFSKALEIGRRSVQFELGKILAAGVFAGNPDRMSGVKTSTGLKRWYKPGQYYSQHGDASGDR